MKRGIGTMWRRVLMLGSVSLVALASSVSVAAAAPLWDVRSSWGPTVLHPGSPARFVYEVRNLGDVPSSGLVTLKASYPPGVKITAVESQEFGTGEGPPGHHWICSGTGTANLSCVTSIPVEIRGTEIGNPRPAGYAQRIHVDLMIGAGTSEGEAPHTVSVTGGGAASGANDTDVLAIGPDEPGFGMVAGSFGADVFDAPFLGSSSLGSPVRQAGAHPFEMRTDFDLNLKWGSDEDGPYTEPDELIRAVRTALPVGLFGNPEATPKCTAQDFLVYPVANTHSGSGTGCPPETQVGVLEVHAQNAHQFFGPGLHSRVPVYNLIPPTGQPADLAFNANGIVVGHIYPTIDPARDHTIRAIVPNISTVGWVRQVRFTLWGVPADPVNDKLRFNPTGGPATAYGASSKAAIRPFLTLPMDCEGEKQFSQTVESWQQQGTESAEAVSPEPGFKATGCDDPRIRFEPKVSLQPTALGAGGPTGLAVNLEVPQRNEVVGNAAELYEENGDVQAIPTPPLKKVVVTLPEGMTVSPSAAQGLGSCSPAQIGLGTSQPVACPQSSRFGSLTLKTPILPKDEPMVGDIYVAEQGNNPFGNFLSLYFVIHDESRGLLVKIPGRVDLDPVNGQITTTFDDLPQFPVSNMQVAIKGGLRAGLVNPQTCGQKTITARFFAWSDPDTPVVRTSSYEITGNPDGSPCHRTLAERPFEPEFRGGSVNPVAGAFSPFAVRFQRSDVDQELASVDGSSPLGLTASLRGTSRCSEAQIAAAAILGRTGKEELAAPSCPASSEVGTVQAGVGVGQVLVYDTGTIYLAGPYKGAPLSGVVITPAIAGPFDLGVIVVRAPVYLDPRTAQVRLASEDLPQIFKGVPIRLRDVRVNLDRPNFTLNPTSCAEKTVGARLFGLNGASKDASHRFQVGDCASLGFKPRLKIRLRGGTERGDYPGLRAELRARKGDANIGRAEVTLPRSAFLEQAHIRTICTRVQFAADSCPKGSIYGHATAHTPLLDEPLSGPVYLRSSNNLLPDMVVDLRGPAHTPIRVELVGRVDSVRGGIRSTFAAVPDAPVSRFILTMQGGKKGLIVNSRDLCARPARATVLMDGQNGRTHDFKPIVRADCKAARKSKRQGGASR